MCKLTDIEIDILVRKNEALKDEVCKLRTENDDLVYKLQGVMWSVDKWLDGKEFEQDEVNRAATMREKTLQITERQQIENERLVKYITNTLSIIPKKVKAEAVKEFAERLKNRMFGYYECLEECAKGRLHNGDRLMDYEVVDMIEDCVDNLVKEMTENEGKE